MSKKDSAMDKTVFMGAELIEMNKKVSKGSELSLREDMWSAVEDFARVNGRLSAHDKVVLIATEVAGLIKDLCDALPKAKGLSDEEVFVHLMANASAWVAAGGTAEMAAEDEGQLHS